MEVRGPSGSSGMGYGKGTGGGEPEVCGKGTGGERQVERKTNVGTSGGNSVGARVEAADQLEMMR